MEKMPDKKENSTQQMGGQSLQTNNEHSSQNGKKNPLSNTEGQPAENAGRKDDEDGELSDFDRHNGSAGAFEGTENGGDDDDKEDDFLKYGR